jgi:hypothetical protein
VTRPGRIQQRPLALALVASELLWNLPFGEYVMFPFKLFATWLHELSHGLAMILTGAGLDHVLIYRDTSGLAYADSTVGGFASALIAAAGYMGTPLWGAALLVLSPTAQTARRALLVLGALLLVSAVTVVEVAPSGDDFGPWASGGMGAACVACALALPAKWRVATAHFIAAQSCINALLDIRVLFRPSQVVDGFVVPGASDAQNMARATFGTTAHWAVWTWAGIWLAWSLVVLFVALRISAAQAARLAVPRARATATPRGESDRDDRRRSPATAPAGTDPSEPADTAGS